VPGILLIRVLFNVINERFAPWPDITSNHPWSIVFIKWWDEIRGAFIRNWDDKGAKYHIEQDAQWLYCCLIKIERLLEVLEVIDHPIRRPIRTIMSGDNLSLKGKINTFLLIIGNHDIILPLTIDIKDRLIIGIAIILFSSILNIGLQELWLHKVANLKRVE